MPVISNEFLNIMLLSKFFSILIIFGLSQSNKISRHLANKNEYEFFDKIRKIVLEEVERANPGLTLTGKFIEKGD